MKTAFGMLATVSKLKFGKNLPVKFNQNTTNKCEVKTTSVGIATSVIGIKVNPSDFFKSSKVKAYNHSYPEDYEYDPKTGNKLWIYSSQPIDEADGNCKLDNSDVKHTLHRYKGWQAFSIYKDADFQILGAGGCSDGATTFLQLSELSNIRNDLKNALRPLGLWDQNRFGLYTAFSILE